MCSSERTQRAPAMLERARLPLQEGSLERHASSGTPHPTVEKLGTIKMKNFASGTCLATALSSIFGEIKIGLGAESVHYISLEKYETLF